MRQDGQRAVDGTPEVGGHGALEIVERHGLHRADQHDPGVIDQDVDASMPFDGEIHQVLALLRIGNVGGDSQDAPRSGMGHFDLGGIEVLGIPRGQYEVRAALGGVTGDHQPVSGRRPRDDHDTICQSDPP